MIYRFSFKIIREDNEVSDERIRGVNSRLMNAR